MMRPLVLLSWLGICCSGCISINQGSRPMGSIVGHHEQSPEPGEWCRITYPEQHAGLLAHSQRAVTGLVESVDDEGIHLSHVNWSVKSGARGLEKLPYVSRYFKNTGMACEAETIVRTDQISQVEIIDKEDAWRPNAQTLAQHLTAAVPGPNRRIVNH